MAKSKFLLLVEGGNDKSFYEEFCRAHGLRADVTISKPKDIGGTHNTKQGAINHLPILLEQLADDRLERLALIIDSDQLDDGGGFDRSVRQVANKLVEYGFSQEPTRLPTGGLVFAHSDGLAEFGLWIMPNNQDEGALEHWISSVVHADHMPLFDHAQAKVAELVTPKFRPIRRLKADVATWLAWQQKPGEGLYFAVEGKLLDSRAPAYIGLLNWMERVFR